MYRILFIDEEKDTLSDFEDYIESFIPEIQFDIITSMPLGEIDDMIDYIIKVNPDALIVDFWLNEKKIDIKYTVKYNGVDLVEEFKKTRQKFPCFVLTARDTDAVGASEDVNIVYTKNLLHTELQDKVKATFASRIISQIEHYKSRIENAKQELAELVELRKAGKANIDIENKIINLDDFLENSIDAKNSIPSEFKTLSNSNRLDSILNKVDELLKKIDKDAK